MGRIIYDWRNVAPDGGYTLEPIKVGKKWIVDGNSATDWIFEKNFPAKWSAEVAIELYQSGGSFADYVETVKSKRRIILTKKDRAAVIKAISNISDKEKLATARHESAHAVVFLRLGIPITSIDLELEIKSEGNDILDVTEGKINAGMSILPRCFEAAAHGNEEAFEFVRKAIVCIIAGPVHDAHIGKCESSKDSKDMEDARELAMRICDGKESNAKPLLESCIFDAAEILQENDATIKRLANALVAKGKLDGAEVKRLVEAA